MAARILFAEDETSIRRLFSEILRREGFDVTSCASAHEACSHLLSDPFDVVITDMRMETPTAGFQVIRAAQQLARPPRIVVLTAFPIPHADLRGYPVAAVITKGTDVSTLIASLHKLIEDAA